MVHDIRGLAPAVADWLRWQFRRRQMDRVDNEKWERVLRDDLPRRVEAAGPPPAGDQDMAPGEAATPAGGALWAPGDAAGGVWSRRQRPDLPRASRKVRGKGYGRPGRPRTYAADEDETADLLAVYRENQSVAAPMLDRCRTPGEQLALLRALRDVARNPNDPAARDRWKATVLRFRPH